MSMFIHDDNMPDGEQEVMIVTSRYIENQNLAIVLICADTLEVFATLTANILPLVPHYAAVDTNNLPNAEDFIKRYKLGKNLNRTIHSGFHDYPVYDFSELLRKFPETT